VNFTTFGATGPVEVRITRLAGAIHTADVSPHSRHVPGQLDPQGRAVGTLKPGDKIWMTMNEDDANPLFIFVDGPKPPIPPGATYFGPGIHDIAPDTENHYKASSGELIYLDAGAWVRGNIDVRGTENVRVEGPGILSGDLWRGEDVGSAAIPFSEFTNYAMITGDYTGGNAARVEGITIVDSPGYNFFGGATHVSGIKVLSPWMYSTDGFQGVSHVDHVFCFNGDNVFGVGGAGFQKDDITFTSSFVATALNSVFAGGYWGRPPYPYTALAEDIDIRSYTDESYAPLIMAAVFQIWVDNADSAFGYSNQTYRNIRIEGDLSAPVLLVKNKVYPWTNAGPHPDPPLGNSYNIIFQNISVEGSQKDLSEIKGWDAHNGFHNVILDNFSFHGERVTQANLGKYFSVNSFVFGLGFTAPPGCASGPDGRPCSIAPAEPGAPLVVTRPRP